jgi:hypothetical protein
MKLKHLYLFSFILVACDDPSLNNRSNDDNNIVSPVDNNNRIASIQIAQDIAANITSTIVLSYNTSGLLTAVTDDRATASSYILVYNNNNSLLQATKTIAGVETTYDITYINDQITININTSGANTLVKQLFTDQQNRINRTVTREIDPSNTSTYLEDTRYNYDPNFNVITVNYINMGTNTVDRSSSFTYELNKNPFKDMNDIARLIIFEYFIPYTRVMPSSQTDFLNNTVQRRLTHTYTLQPNGFPTSREVTTLEAGATTTRFEFFNYLP